MSRTGEQEDEDDCFYESLDRIVSSSCSSSTTTTTPNSDNEDKDGISNPCSPNYASAHQFAVPKFPMAATKYDVWISEPSSVSERRTRLLSQMGLSSDPSLSRAKPTGLRSVSSDCLNGKDQGEGSVVSSMVRSKSDGVCGNGRQGESHDHRCSSNYSASVHNHNSGIVKLQNGKSNESPHEAVLAKCTTKVDENENDSLRLNSYHNCNRVLDDDLECNGIGRINEQLCRIKNLDNGTEFVVNEIRADGMWNKIKEVGTGKEVSLEEFERNVGHSPIVQELMRRQDVEECKDNLDFNGNTVSEVGVKLKKKSRWFNSIKSVASSVTGHKERRHSDEKDSSSEKARRSSSATDDSQDVSFHGPERVRVKQYGKSSKELTALYKSQELQAHNGSIWSIKFSLDGRYLASAGEDCVIQVWQVLESERKGDTMMDKREDGHLNVLFLANGSPDCTSMSPIAENHSGKKRRGRSSTSRKSISLEQILVPETVFGLSEKPICSFQGHLDDVLDLSWSKSQLLLSSSMDKTVRLWHLSNKSCLKIFSHIDYVTCIQFNPVDDRYFISGSLDAKVRIWSIPDCQVVDWNDVHEMVTAACYTPDGQGALVGSYKGSCRLYDTSENKLQEKKQIDLQNKKKKPHQKKITGFQFTPGSSSEVLITSADSRIRVIEGVDMVHKLKGFHNTNSQISASLTANGKYVVAASEDSYVYVWKHEADSRPGRYKGVTITGSYEHFQCQDVSVAIPWPGMADSWGIEDTYCGGQQNEKDNVFDEVSTANYPSTPVEEPNSDKGSQYASGFTNSPLHGVSNSYFFDRISATWPEEKLHVAVETCNSWPSIDFQKMSSWGMVIVTAGLRGEIKTFQNFGLPFRI